MSEQLDGLCEAWYEACLMMERRGHTNLAQVSLAGELVTETVHGKAGEWTVEVNPHKEVVDGIAPFEVRVTFNGWPAGLLDAAGGLLAAGCLANEESFLADMRAAI